uniref:Uncharacterized protein n=1 Tax=Arundo donax TaxID=35708 RepID=A0A0A8ZZ95_ARUDO
MLEFILVKTYSMFSAYVLTLY